MIVQWSEEKLRFLASTGHALALGGPGSGKTHVSLVKARELIRSGVLREGQKVLFLSFARTTVSRILEKATDLVPSAEMRYLEVNTYHSFIWSILKAHAYLLNGKRRVTLLPPPEASAHMADIAKPNRDAESLRLFYEEGRLHFDLFARLGAQLFASCSRLATIYSSAYPVIVLDEFQDTDADQWALMQHLGRRSRLIALGDPDQRIYEFRGADPARLKQFLDATAADSFDFAGENHRSDGTDINRFSKDLLSGSNKGKTYENVKVVHYPVYKGRNIHYATKTELLAAFRRLAKTPDSSIALLVPTRAMMIDLSDYLSSTDNKLPSLSHEVAMDAEPPALAAGVIAAAMAGGSSGEVASRLVAALHTYIRGRGGRDGTPQAELALAGAIGDFMASGKVRGANRKLLVDECQRVANVCAGMAHSGNPEEDWVSVRQLFKESAAPHLQKVYGDARFLRLLHRGSALRISLGELWRTRGSYVGAEQAVRDALLQEHFSAATTKSRGVHVMTMHKSKGKEFDEVILSEGKFAGRFNGAPGDPKRVEQSRLALLVAVSRARRRTTILTPKRDACAFL
jgi:DNA helicase-2/ATP-dependent DNA helicase PcrA